MPVASLRGCDIYFEEQGDGEPIILLPGLGHDHTYYAKTVPLLASAGRTIAPDPRGLGLSKTSATLYSIEEWAKDVIDLVRSLRRTFINTEEGKAAVERLFASVQRNSSERYIAFIRAILEFGRVEPHQARQVKVTERLAEIKIPTCVIVGEEDILTPVSHAKLMAQRIPGAELHVIAGCGHITFTEKPEETAGLIRTFLRKVVA